VSLLLCQNAAPRQRGRDPHCVLSLGVGPCNCSTDSRDTTASEPAWRQVQDRDAGDGAPESRAVSPLLAESGGRAGAERDGSYFARFPPRRLSGRADPRCGSQRATMCALTSETARGIQAPVVT